MFIYTYSFIHYIHYICIYILFLNAGLCGHETLHSQHYTGLKFPANLTRVIVKFMPLDDIKRPNSCSFRDLEMSPLTSFRAHDFVMLRDHCIALSSGLFNN